MRTVFERIVQCIKAIDSLIHRYFSETTKRTNLNLRTVVRSVL